MTTATRHTIAACRSGSYNGMDYDLDYEITFTCQPGVAGGEPELQFVAIEPDAGDHGAFSDLAQKGLEDWARDWLDDNFDRALEKALTDRVGGGLIR